jgi:hypothetical protein
MPSMTLTKGDKFMYAWFCAAAFRAPKRGKTSDLTNINLMRSLFTRIYFFHIPHRLQNVSFNLARLLAHPV